MIYQYAVESQIRHWGFYPDEAMVLIEPDDDGVLISTQHIYNIIDEHADTTALLLLSGVQFYTGQYFDIRGITTYAQSRGIIVGWDLAHAVGNLPVQLHDWDVDFAVWCNYKYVNAGPGAIAGIFVHEKHGRVENGGDTVGNNQEGGGNTTINYRPRLTGWWGSDRSTRFDMENRFIPIEGAAGYQLSNPSATDLAVLLASLSIFNQTDMFTLRRHSMELTGYLYHLMTRSPPPLSSRRRQPRDLNGASIEENYHVGDGEGRDHRHQQPDRVSINGHHQPEDEDEHADHHRARDEEGSTTPSHPHESNHASSTSASTALNLTIPSQVSQVEKSIQSSYEILTPSNPLERGAQLSVRLSPPHLLPIIMRELKNAGIVVDHRNPNVIRVAPVPLYNSFEDVWRFGRGFKNAVGIALVETGVGDVGGDLEGLDDDDDGDDGER